jgi:hypothetical protein
MFGGNVRVATNAVVGFMRGQLQLGHIHKERHGFASGIGFNQRVIAMAIKAIAIFQPRERRDRDKQKQPKYKGYTAFHTLFLGK